MRILTTILYLLNLSNTDQQNWIYLSLSNQFLFISVHLLVILFCRTFKFCVLHTCNKILYFTEQPTHNSSSLVDYTEQLYFYRTIMIEKRNAFLVSSCIQHVFPAVIQQFYFTVPNRNGQDRAGQQQAYCSIFSCHLFRLCHQLYYNQELPLVCNKR